MVSTLARPGVPSPRLRTTPVEAPSFVYHPSFEDNDAERRYRAVLPAGEDDTLGYMPDDATRAWSQQMHYAAWRTAHGRSARDAARWRQRYYACRDRIILGNRKLTFRAVQKWGVAQQCTDDFGAECQVVLIKAVAAFNPWLSIRFSTYAFTCLLRALARLSRRQAADQLAHAVPLESLSLGEPEQALDAEADDPRVAQLNRFFRDENELLTAREKSVLKRRFYLADGATRSATLEQVGRDLGLSKERVRQLQLSALDKLRAALAGPVPVAAMPR